MPTAGIELVRPGPAAVGLGTVWHRRNGSPDAAKSSRNETHHEFRYSTLQVWLDPDHPTDIVDHHRLWSTGRLRPVQFRRSDYFDGGTGPIGPAVRNQFAEQTGLAPTGPLRMLTQPRTWGWLFNPITAYLLWRDPNSDPIGAVLEVTNTPWKERHHYSVAFEPTQDGAMVAEFDKILHVSPFLDERHRYRLRFHIDEQSTKRVLNLSIDVVNANAPSNARPILETATSVTLVPPSKKVLTWAPLHTPLATHRVSLGIHTQAARLAAKRVPFVSHPSKRTSPGQKPTDPAPARHRR